MPPRRPLNRRREKAKAAQAPMNTAPIAPTNEMIIEFLYQLQNGRELSLNSVVKLAVEKPEGHRLAVLSVPLGFVAADQMKRIGKSAQARATRPRAWRH